MLQVTRAAKTAPSSLAAVTPSAAAARVKPEPGTAAAAAAAGEPSSSGAGQKMEPRSKGKKTGGGRDGYAVRQSVLDDDWEDELEDEAEDLSKCILFRTRPSRIWCACCLVFILMSLLHVQGLLLRKRLFGFHAYDCTWLASLSDVCWTTARPAVTACCAPCHMPKI